MEHKVHKHTGHHILAHSYIVYFTLLLVGVILDLIFNIKIFTDSIMTPVGFILLFLATILIFWAQKTGHELRKLSEVKSEHFSRGPYRYTRIPTQIGLFILLVGFGFITNSPFVIVFTGIAFFVAKFIFMDKHERMMAEKYGESYLEYKRSVKF